MNEPTTINGKPISSVGKLHLQAIVAPGDPTRHGSLKCFRAETPQDAQAAIGRWERFNKEKTVRKAVI
jgi:hypothetical protein